MPVCTILITTCPDSSRFLHDHVVTFIWCGGVRPYGMHIKFIGQRRVTLSDTNALFQLIRNTEAIRPFVLVKWDGQF